MSRRPAAPPRARCRLAAAVAGAGLLAACGGGDGEAAGDQAVTSGPELERFLAAEAARTSGGLAVRDVRCPRQLPMADGGSVECTAVVGGTTVAYTVTRLVGQRLEVRPTRPVVDVRASAAAVEADLGDGFQVGCPGPGVVQVEVGARLGCTVKGPDGATRRIELVVEDESGRVRAVDA